jgi:hypothetical protein
VQTAVNYTLELAGKMVVVAFEEVSVEMILVSDDVAIRRLLF